MESKIIPEVAKSAKVLGLELKSKKGKISKLALLSPVILILYGCFLLPMQIFLFDFIIAIITCLASITIGIIAIAKIEKNREKIAGRLLALIGILFSIILIMSTAVGFYNNNKAHLRAGALMNKTNIEQNSRQQGDLMAGVIKRKYTKVMSGKSTQSQSRVHQWFSFGWKLLVGLATLLGLVTTLYSLSANVAVSSDSPIDPQKPFSSPFNIENSSIFPVYNVQFSCTLRDVKWQNDTRVINIRTRTDAAPIMRMNAREITTTFCKPLPFKTPIESADIEVEVKYRPAYLPWPKRSSFRFGTVTESNGTLRWVPRALSE